MSQQHEQEGQEQPQHQDAEGDEQGPEETVHQQSAPEDATNTEEKEGDDEDIGRLVDELNSDDEGAEEDEEGHGDDDRKKSATVSDAFLQTDSTRGLTSEEVASRKKKFGANQMKEEKENLVLKFCSFFLGPIQYVMEVSISCSSRCHIFLYVANMDRRLPLFLRQVWRTGSTLVSYVVCSSLMPPLDSSRSSKLAQS